MVQNVFIAVSAGLASALLFASIASGWVGGLFLFYLAPVPVAIATLGWGTATGLAAAGVAASVVAAIYGGFFFLAHPLAIGLPAWWIATLATRRTPQSPDGEWMPVGRIVYWCGLVASAIMIVGLLNLGWDEATVRASLQQAFQRTVAQADPAVVARLAGIVPGAAAGLTTIVVIFDIWLAARIVKASGRTPRPWPALTAMRAPPDAFALLVAAAVALFAGGLVGMIATIVLAAMIVVFGFYGLATLHVLTARLSGRPVILGAAYAAIVILAWPILAATALGIADFLFNLRGRATPAPRPPMT